MKNLFLINPSIHRGAQEFVSGRIERQSGGKKSVLNIFPTKPKPPIAFQYFFPILREAGLHPQYLSAALMLETGILSMDDYYKSWRDFVAKHTPSIFAFTTNAQYYPTALNMSAVCKDVSGKNITIHGGPQATSVGTALFEEFDFVDYAVIGDGEETFPLLLQRLLAGDGSNAPDDIGGVISRYSNASGAGSSAPPLNLETLPSPDISVFSPKEFHEEGVGAHVVLETSRGCPFICSYCTVSGSGYREKSVEMVIKEAQYAKETLPELTQFTFASNMLFAGKRKVLEFCNEYRATGVGIPWGCFARTDSIDGEVASRMNEAGCFVVHFGLETGSGHMQSVIGKNMNVGKAILAIEATMNAGICATVNFIIGFPEESYKTINETIAVMLRLKKAGAKIYSTILSPHYGTEYHSEHKSSLIFNKNRLPEIFFQEDMNLIKRHPEIFSFFYYIKPLEVSIEEFELLYHVMIGQLIGKIPDAVMNAAGLFDGDYVAMNRGFAKYLCNDETDGEDIPTIFTRFIEKVGGSHA